MKKSCCHNSEGYEQDKTLASKYDINLLDDLKRRVDVTYRTRINASNRLRDKHNEYKKLNIYYSALVTGVSILSIGIETNIASISVSNIVLMFSIVLTYFMFYVSEENLQERAYRMEETFKSLDKLSNKISIKVKYKESSITEEICTKFYKEYESILISIENHEPIDYCRYKIASVKKEDLKANKIKAYEEHEKTVKKYDTYDEIKVYLKYIIPTVVMLTVILISM